LAQSHIFFEEEKFGMATFIGSNISPKYSRVPKVLFSFDLLPNLAKSSFGFLLVHLPHIELKKKNPNKI
jgi:hypothetical protein